MNARAAAPRDHRPARAGAVIHRLTFRKPVFQSKPGLPKQLRSPESRLDNLFPRLWVNKVSRPIVGTPPRASTGAVPRPGPPPAPPHLTSHCKRDAQSECRHSPAGLKLCSYGRTTTTLRTCWHREQQVARNLPNGVLLAERRNGSVINFFRILAVFRARGTLSWRRTAGPSSAPFPRTHASGSVWRRRVFPAPELACRSCVFGLMFHLRCAATVRTQFEKAVNGALMTWAGPGGAGKAART